MSIWFVAGLICVVLLAIASPQLASVTSSFDHQGSLHAYTPKNQPGSLYWSEGISRDSNHLPSL